MSESVATKERETVEETGVRVKADILGTFLDYINPIADECKLQTSADGFETQVVDPANVGMVSATLPERNIIDGTLGDGLLGINRGRLADIVGMADDEVVLDLDEETRKLTVSSDGLEFTMSLIDPDSIRQEPELPDLEEQWTAEVVIPAKRLQSAIKATQLVSDHVEFRADPDAREFVVAAQGDTDDVEWRFGEDELVEADVSETAESRFSLDYIEPIVKAFGKDVHIAIQFGEELPVSMAGAAESGHVEYLIAPRIESNGGGR